MKVASKAPSIHTEVYRGHVDLPCPWPHVGRARLVEGLAGAYTPNHHSSTIIHHLRHDTANVGLGDEVTTLNDRPKLRPGWAVVWLGKCLLCQGYDLGYILTLV